MSQRMSDCLQWWRVISIESLSQQSNGKAESFPWKASAHTTLAKHPTSQSKPHPKPSVSTTGEETSSSGEGTAASHGEGHACESSHKGRVRSWEQHHLPNVLHLTLQKLPLESANLNPHHWEKETFWLITGPTQKVTARDNENAWLSLITVPVQWNGTEK